MGFATVPTIAKVTAAGEQWIAVATGGSMYLFRTVELELFNSDARPEAIRIPVHAEDLEWR